MRKKLLILLSSLCILTGCSKGIELQKQTFTVELGQDVYGNPSLYVKNPENYDTDMMQVRASTGNIAKKENRFVNTDSDYLGVGEYDFELYYQGKSYPFKIKIKDTQPPTLMASPTDVQANIGEIINWQEIFKATDLSGVSYEAPNDVTAETGVKTIVVTIHDKFGNKVDKTVRVNVIDPVEEQRKKELEEQERLEAEQALNEVDEENPYAEDTYDESLYGQ